MWDSFLVKDIKITCVSAISFIIDNKLQTDWVPIREFNTSLFIRSIGNISSKVFINP